MFYVGLDVHTKQVTISAHREFWMQFGMRERTALSDRM